jgi:hypothetical protein
MKMHALKRGPASPADLLDLISEMVLEDRFNDDGWIDWWIGWQWVARHPCAFQKLFTYASVFALYYICTPGREQKGLEWLGRDSNAYQAHWLSLLLNVRRPIHWRSTRLWAEAMHGMLPRPRFRISSVQVSVPCGPIGTKREPLGRPIHTMRMTESMQNVEKGQSVPSQTSKAPVPGEMSPLRNQPSQGILVKKQIEWVHVVPSDGLVAGDIWGLSSPCIHTYIHIYIYIY